MPANPQSKRVAIIGAGPSGLATVKALLEEGHQPICFEKAASLGGVFRFGEDDGVVWDSCRLTSSGLLTAFSDFPVTPELSGHMTARQYVDYLTRYCDAFDVTRHIRFGASVDAVAQQTSGPWTIRWHDASGQHAEDFGAVAVCSGLHQHPHRARFPGQETFPGTIMHGAQYRRPTQVVGKKVLIVGAGESGADVVAEVAAHAAETVLSLRRGVAVQPRIRLGKPGDYLTSRLANSAADWIGETHDPADDWKRTRYRALFLPVALIDRLLQIVFRLGWDMLPLFAARRVADVALNIKTRHLVKRLLAESGGALMEQFGTKTDEFVRAIARGQCTLAPAIERFDGSRVTFADGCSAEFDLVILCTGFDTKIPFLDENVAASPRYLHTFNPAVGTGLAFIGFVRPAFGAIPPLAELQARWFALLQSGRVQLPTADVMRASITRWMRFHAHMFRPLKGRLEHLVDHTSFCDELAAEIGCKPTRAALRRESLRFRLRFFAGPFVPAQYRLVGPHAKPDIARAVIGSVPIVHPTPKLISHYLRWRTSQALRRLLGPEFSPKLAID